MAGSAQHSLDHTAPHAPLKGMPFVLFSPWLASATPCSRSTYGRAAHLCLSRPRLETSSRQPPPAWMTSRQNSCL